MHPCNGCWRSILQHVRNCWFIIIINNNANKMLAYFLHSLDKNQINNVLAMLMLIGTAVNSF